MMRPLSISWEIRWSGHAQQHGLTASDRHSFAVALLAGGFGFAAVLGFLGFHWIVGATPAGGVYHRSGPGIVSDTIADVVTVL